MTDIVKDIEAVATAGMGIQTKLVLVLGAATVISLAGFGLANHFEARGRALERAGWVEKEAKERAADVQLLRDHAADIQQLQDHFADIARKTSEDYETELAQLRLERDADRRRVDAAGGLRIPAPACAAGGAVAGPEAAGAGGRDEASASTVRLPEQVENDLWDIADTADQVSAQLRACQSWIRANGFYGPAPAVSTPLLDRMVSFKNHDGEDQHAAD